MAKLAALASKPGGNLTQFHGVFALNSKHRVQVTPTKRGKKVDSEPPDTDWQDKRPADRHRVMSWMQRLKRIFNTDIEVCEHCGGQVKVIASIEDPKVIEQILNTLSRKQPSITSYRQNVYHRWFPACSILHNLAYLTDVSGFFSYTANFHRGRWSNVM